MARVEACELLFRRERAAIGCVAAVRAQLETGRASIAAGAVESGLDCLKRARAEAEPCGDDNSRARVQLALGSTLVHAMIDRGDAAAAHHRATEIARRIGASDIAATAHRELAFVDV